MDVTRDVIDVETPDGPMAVLHRKPVGSGPWPRIVMFHDGPGIRTATHDFIDKLAADGFEVVVPDLFHRHGRLIGFEPHQRAADPSVGERVMAMIRALTDDGIQADLDATLGMVDRRDGERLGAIGFCLGARAVFRTLMRLPDVFAAGAMWHPSFLVDDTSDSPHLTAAELHQPLYIGIGDADQVQSIAMHRPFLDAVAPLDHVDVDVFPGADHGYTWPDHPTYDPSASDTSFIKTVALLRGAL